MTEAEWLASDDPTVMLTYFDFLNRVDPGSKRQARSGRKLRLWACACVRQVWDKLVDDAPCGRCGGQGSVSGGPGGQVVGLEPRRACLICSGTGRVNRSRRAVEVAERYADEGEVVARQMGREWLWLDMESDHFDGWLAVYLACSPPDSIVRDLREHAEGLARLVPPAVQAALLRSIVGNPFRPVTCRECGPTCGGRYEVTRFCKDSPLAAWLRWQDGTIPALARKMYQERQFNEMPILGDMLEDSGCCDSQILNHCRGGGPYVRGDWVVDIILGKS